MASDCAPIALFAFRRPDHLRRCLDSLRDNPQASSTDLWIFCDGPRHEADETSVRDVREIARGVQGFARVSVIEQPRNIGLATSVISGVSDVLTVAERVIVVEDDLVVSPDFLEFMNEALELYADSPEVASIHGFSYAVDTPLPQSFFLRGADCWGWATWRRGWALFNPDGQALLSELDSRGLGRSFDFDGVYPYREMLVNQVAGRIDSWAVRWNASVYLAGGFTLYPGVSLVENIGQDGSGTHSIASESHGSKSHRFDFPLTRIPVADSAMAREAITRALGKSYGGGIIGSLRRRLSRARG